MDSSQQQQRTSSDEEIMPNPITVLPRRNLSRRARGNRSNTGVKKSSATRRQTQSGRLSLKDSVAPGESRERNEAEGHGLPARKRGKQLLTQRSVPISLPDERVTPGAGIYAGATEEETENTPDIFGTGRHRISLLRSQAAGSNKPLDTNEEEPQAVSGLDYIGPDRQVEESSSLEVRISGRDKNLVAPGLVLPISETPVVPISETPTDIPVNHPMSSVRVQDVRFKKLQDENRRMTDQLNEYKRKISTTTIENKRLKSANSALADKLVRNQERIDNLLLENESLRVSGGMNSSDEGRNEEVEVGRRRRRELQLDVKFLGIGSCVEKKIQQWCRMEIQELCGWEENMKRNWKNRSEITGVMGYQLEGDKFFVPIPPLTLANRHEYYTPYYKKYVSLLGDIFDMEVSKSKWSTIISADVREECKKAIIGEKSLLKKVRTNLSDELNRAKRNARDKLMKGLGYSFMVSRAIKPANADEKEKKVDQRRQLMEKLFGMEEDEYNLSLTSIDLSLWRRKEVSLLCYSEQETVENIAEEIQRDLLFRNKIALEVLQEFRGFNVSDDENRTIQSSILLLARLDAWILSFCKCGNRDEDKGGETQKKFKKEYSKALPEATRQVLRFICDIVQERYPEELQIAYGDDESDEFGNGKRIATAIVYVPSDELYYIQVKPSWFRKEITPFLGNVMDCFIGRGNLSGSDLEIEGDEENIIEGTGGEIVASVEV